MASEEMVPIVRVLLRFHPKLANQPRVAQSRCVLLLGRQPDRPPIASGRQVRICLHDGSA